MKKLVIIAVFAMQTSIAVTKKLGDFNTVKSIR
jgi:hypothetical protein